jgi:hypothetical protein
MSLRIGVDDIMAVLLPDGWHKVDRMSNRLDAVSSFDTDAYEFLDSEGHILYGGGTGFRFTENTSQIFGPISSILAVKPYKRAND